MSLKKSNVHAKLYVPRAENHAAAGGIGGGAAVDDALGQRAARHMSSLITASIVRSSSRRNLIPPVRVQPGASADRKLEKASMARARACSGPASTASWMETAVAAAAAGCGGWWRMDGMWRERTEAWRTTC